MQDCAVNGDRLLWIVLPFELEIEQRLQGFGACPEHRANREIEEWRQRIIDPNALGEVVGDFREIQVPPREMRIFREHNAKRFIDREAFEDDVVVG